MRQKHNYIVRSVTLNNAVPKSLASLQAIIENRRQGNFVGLSINVFKFKSGPDICHQPDHDMRGRDDDPKNHQSVQLPRLQNQLNVV